MRERGMKIVKRYRNSEKEREEREERKERERVRRRRREWERYKDIEKEIVEEI